jgi:nitrate reductase delta subunit
MNKPSHPGPALAALAALLEYPSETHPAIPDRTALAGYPQALAELDRFASGFQALSPEEREEVFTATFDVSPAVAPYLSIHLFGEENFKRGDFMAALNARYAQTGFSPGDELPDHVRNLLRFAATIPPEELRELAQFCLVTPLGVMAEKLRAENPYRALLAAARAVLEEAHPGLVPAPIPQAAAAGAATFCHVQTAGCGCPGAAALMEPSLTQ